VKLSATSAHSAIQIFLIFRKQKSIHRRGRRDRGEDWGEQVVISASSALSAIQSLDSAWNVPMRINDLTSAIIGAAIKVHQRLGPGLLESVYRICLAYELRKLGFEVEEEKPIPVVYDSVKLECGFRADLMVNGQVVVECKAKSKLLPIDAAQTGSHLRLTGLQVGLLINFHELVLKNGIQRIVNNYEEPKDDL
jgi:GxxExxY protein